MADKHPCSHLIDGKCKSGWPESLACSPWPIGHGEWMPIQKPYCMNEEMAARMFPETGAPPAPEGDSGDG